VIVTLDQGKGRIDGGLMCETCGRVGLWQPDELDPCTDAWWCRDCRSWSADPLAIEGKHALCVVGDSHGRSSGRGDVPLAYGEIVPVCKCDCSWPIRWCHGFIRMIQSWYLKRRK